MRLNRRDLLVKSGQTLVGGAILGGGLALLARVLGAESPQYVVAGEPGILRPPGALEEREFLATCIRCQRCQDACPSQAIRLARPGERAATGTPFILPTDHGCTLCLECTRTCPTGALRLTQDKTQVAMGTAAIDERLCVVLNHSGICGACHTACPLKNKAIRLGLRNAPEVDPDHCVGCGLCEEACILKGTKAIRVYSDRGPS